MGDEPGSHGSLGFCCMRGKAGRSVPFSAVHVSPLTLPSALKRFLPQSHRDPPSTPLLSHRSPVQIEPRHRVHSFRESSLDTWGI